MERAMSHTSIDTFLSVPIDTRSDSNSLGRTYTVWVRTFSLYADERKTIGKTIGYCSVWMPIPIEVAAE